MTDPLNELRAAVAHVLRTHGLSAADLSLLAHQRAERNPAAKPVLLPDGDLADAPAEVLRAIGELLDERLDTTLLQRFGRLFQSRVRQLGRTIRGVAATVLLLGVTYLVVGAAVEARSELTSDPVGVLLLLALCLFVLAVFEGMHIAVTVLRFSDLSGIGADRHRVRRLHRIFRWEDGCRRFLAGRQFAVVMVVFVISRMTTFSGTTWPFTDQEMPGFLAELGYRYGVAGALFTLWWGQLVPQFLANKRPLWFGNLVLSTVAFSFGNLVEHLGITAPADWVASLDSGPQEAEIPTSPQYRYRQAATAIEGRGYLGVRKEWEIARNSAAATHTVYTHIAAKNIEALTTQGLLIGGYAPESLEARQTLLRDGDTASLSEGFDGDVRLSDLRAPQTTAKPAVGWFQPGDILHTEFKIRGKDPGEDTVPILGPTKHLVFKLVLTDAPRSFQGVAVTISRVSQEVSDHSVDAAKGRISSCWIPAEPVGEGRAVAQAYFPYPDVGAVYLFRWNIDW